MKKLMACALFVLFGVSGCATVQKELVATGGSKAAGVVELSYEYEETEKPVVDVKQGELIALKRCQAWGYKNVEAFGGMRTQCTMPGGWTGCRRHYVSVQYQCLDE